jgi:hypothetical protein
MGYGADVSGNLRPCGRSDAIANQGKHSRVNENNDKSLFTMTEIASVRGTVYE